MFADQITSTDRACLDIFFARKAKRRGLAHSLPTLQQTADSYK